MSQTDSRIDKPKDKEKEECEGGGGAQEVRKSRGRELCLGALDVDLAVAAEARVFEKAGRHQDGGDAALRVLDINSSVAADDVLRAREDADDTMSKGATMSSEDCAYSVVARFPA